MNWLAANWGQVALVILAFLIWREVRAARMWLNEIFEAIWTHPEMEAVAAKAKERATDHDARDSSAHWPERVTSTDSAGTPEPRPLPHPRVPAG